MFPNHRSSGIQLYDRFEPGLKFSLTTDCNRSSSPKPIVEWFQHQKQVENTIPNKFLVKNLIDI